MKKEIKIYLEEADLKRLKEKAEALGFEGRGAISRYISKVSKQPIVFLDENVKALLNSLNLTPA